MYREVVLEESGCTYYFLKNRITSEVIRHRESGPAIIHANGTRVWYLNGKRHRESGPAYIDADGTQVWYLNGELHRELGPAVIGADGSQEWWLNGNKYSFKEYVNELFPKESPQRTLFVLKWS